MKNKILIIMFSVLVLFIWSCDEEPPLGPEMPAQEELDKAIPYGTVTPVVLLETGNSPEGIAIDWRGNMYISNTRGVDRSINEILKFKNNGSWEVYATFPGSGHARGLVTDLFGNVYVAFATSDEATNGVYRIGYSRIPMRLKGSEKIGSPNALTFDWHGNLYATDSDGGSVWKYGKNRHFKKWFDDPLLKGGIVPGGPPVPLPGANGIAFYPPNKLYVANTAQNSVSRIKIGRDGKAASIKLVGQDSLLMNIDGIAVDIYENIYGVLVPSTIAIYPPADLELPPLVKLNPKSGEIIQVVTFEQRDKFDTPTSLAFGRGWGNWGSIYIANAALQYGQPPVAGPGVVKVKVGVFGLGKK